MSREEVIGRLTPIATEAPSWDERRQRLIVPLPDLGPFRRVEMNFVPGLRSVFFRVAWPCSFDLFLESAEDLEAWLDDPAAEGLAGKVEAARPRLENKGNASMSMSVMLLMTPLPDGAHLSISAAAFRPASGQAYGFEMTWRPFDPTAPQP